MTDEPTHANREDLPEADRHDAVTAVPGHLALALRDYFDVAAQAPLPDRLGELLARFEAALATLGGRVETVFRDDLVRALPMLRTFAISLTANPSRADDLVQETMVKAWARPSGFGCSS